MSEPVLKWGCCELYSDDEDYMQCSACDGAFHLACIAATSNQDITSLQLPPNWICPACIHSKPKKRTNDNTPLRGHHNVTTRPPKRIAVNSPPEVGVTYAASKDEFAKIVQDLFDKRMDGFMMQLSSKIKSVICSELAPVKQQINDLQTSMAFMNDQYEDIIKNQKEASEAMKHLQSENYQLQIDVRDLNNRLNQMEQHGRASNAEIQCVPESKNENMIEIVKNLSKVTDCFLKEENIVSCTRIAKLDRTSPRPRSIIVQFTSQRVRDLFLSSVITYNKSNPDDKLNSVHTGSTAIKTPIYVTEHLSAANKRIHAAARLKAKQTGYQYCWVRNGRIFMRKDDAAEYKWIKDIDTLNKIV